MRRVLVTGASGYIGRHTLAPLLQKGYEVHAVFSKNKIDDDPRIIWHQADLLNTAEHSRLCREIQPTHLLHFAWYVDPKDYKTSPENQKWSVATLSLLEQFRKNGGTRATLAGTVMEYDWSVPQDLFNESTSAIKPVNPYGDAKHETHEKARAFAKESGLSLSWGRIFYSYGPHEAQARLVPYIINALLKNEEALCGAGDQVRDFSFVSNMGGAFAALLDSPVEGAVNVGSGAGVALKDIAQTIGKILGKEHLIKLGARPTPAGEPHRIVADIARLKNEVRWNETTPLETGLSQTIEWWKKYSV